MMYSDNEEIENVARVHNIPLEKLDPITCEAIVNSLIKKYCTESTYAFPLWDHIDLKKKRSVHDSDGWMKVQHYHFKKDIILLTEPKKGYHAYRLESATDLHKLLEESYHFVFYLLDKELSFLICFNDHDYLIGCGDVFNWIGDVSG